MSFLTELQKKKPGKRPIFRSSITVRGIKVLSTTLGNTDTKHLCFGYNSLVK